MILQIYVLLMILYYMILENVYIYICLGRYYNEYCCSLPKILIKIYGFSPTSQFLSEWAAC